MMLLIWSSDKALDCASALECEFQQSVRTASSLEQAGEDLKAFSFSAVLLDQSLSDNYPAKCDFIFQHLGEATPVVANFALCTMDRIARMVRSAVAQHNREVQVARRSACRVLKGELKDELTALLLACGMAESELTGPAVERIRQIEQIASGIQHKLADEKSLAVGKG